MYALQKACQEIGGIQQVFGVEMYIRWDGIAGFGIDKKKKKKEVSEELSFADEIVESEGSGNEGIPHSTILVRNQEGFQNLSALMRLASHPDNRRRGRATASFDQIREHCNGLIITSGCGTGIPARLMCDNNLKITRNERSPRGTDEAIKYLDQLRGLEKHGAMPIIEIVAQPGWRLSELSYEVLEDYAQKHNMRCVLTSDSHFVNAEDFAKQDLVLRIGTNNPYREEKKIGIPDYQYFRSAKELIGHAVDMGMDSASAREYVTNAKAMVEVFENVEIKKGSYPKYTVVSGTATDELRARCVRGVTDRADGATRAERVARLEHELDVINRKGIADYFLLLSDMTEYIYRRGFICVCRGSAGGSLVAFACGISQTDPMPQGLLFSRFYDEERTDPPDIDLDFSPDARKIAVEFLAARYHTAKLLSLNILTRKSAIIDTAHMLGINRDEIEGALSVCNDEMDDVRDVELLPVEITSLYAHYPRLSLAEKLVGVPRHESKNAAGLVVSSEPIPIPCLHDSDGDLITSVDKKEIDSLGLLKVDLLSVRALGIIESCMKKIDMSLDGLYAIDHNHQDVNAILRNAMVRPAGLFQLDGSVLTVLERIVSTDSNMFNECNVASALARPGAMKFVGKYAKRERTGNPILDETYGVIVFQETIMALCVGTSLPPNKLRKVVSKSMNAEVKRLVEEAGGLGLSEELLENLLDSGLYSFNKSHCVTYTKVLLWMSYLKMNYPVQFLEAYINYESDQADVNHGLIRRLINEEIVRTGGIHILPLDRTKNKYFDYTGKTLAGSYLATGLSARKYLSESTANTPTRVAEAESAQRLSMEYSFGKGNFSYIDLLEVFPWVPTKNLDDMPLHTESENFLEGEAVLTYTRKLPMTKATPFASVQYVLESGKGLVHGKVSAKYYLKYRTILDTPLGTKAYIEYNAVRSRCKLGTFDPQ